MSQQIGHEAAIPNPSLERFRVLVGTWNTVGTHPMVPGITLHGRSSFEWIEGGAFLIIRSEILDEESFPSGIAVIGHDDSQEDYSMVYFDERGVSRIIQTTLSGNVWKTWRNATGFLQRFTGTISEDGNTIVGKGEMCRDGSTWEGDLSLTYSRVR
jgi:hypothetical protein